MTITLRKELEQLQGSLLKKFRPARECNHWPHDCAACCASKTSGSCSPLSLCCISQEPCKLSLTWHFMCFLSYQQLWGQLSEDKLRTGQLPAIALSMVQFPFLTVFFISPCNCSSWFLDCDDRLNLKSQPYMSWRFNFHIIYLELSLLMKKISHRCNSEIGELHFLVEVLFCKRVGSLHSYCVENQSILNQMWNLGDGFLSNEGTLQFEVFEKYKVEYRLQIV